MSRELFDAIVAAPEDDAPRLVYADWLTERGDPRGELIVLQCQLARGDEARGLSDRESALLTRHKRRWLRDAGVEAGEFRRGFLESASLGAKTFLKARDRLEAASVLRDLTLGRVKPADVAAIATAPVLRRLRRLRIEATPQYLLGPAEACELAGGDTLANVETLVLAGHPIQSGGAAALVGSLRRLRALDLARCGVSSLASFAPAPLLERLDLSHDPLHSEDVRRLATLTPSLVELRLYGTTTVEGDLEELCSRLPRIERLTLGRAGLDARGIALLRKLPLVELVLSGNALGARAVGALLDAPLIETLATLDVSHSAIEPAGLVAIASRPPPALVNLRLTGAGIDTESVRALARSKLARQLETLALSDNDLGADAALALASVEWPKLQSLELYGMRLQSGPAKRALRERFRDRLVWSE